MSAASQDPSPKPAPLQRAKGMIVRYRWWLASLFGLVVLFGLLGYFWLPGFAKGKAEALLSEYLHRPVTIEQVEVHPYSLEATIRGFRVGERSGEGALLKFESLYVNLSSMSIARAAPVINAVTLKAPEIHLSRDSNGQLSIADLIEVIMNQPPSEGGEARFSVSNIQIEGGSFTFDDQLKHSRQRVTDINVGVPFVASFASAEDVWVQPHFSARINDGSLVSLNGQVLPFADTREAQMTVDLKAFDLMGVDEYAPEIKGIKLRSALLDTNLTLAFAQGNEQPAEIKINGDIVLRKFDVENKVGLPWQVRGDRVTVHVDGFSPLLQSAFTTSVDLENVHMTQGNKPEMLVNALSIRDAKIDPSAKNATLGLVATINGKGSLKVDGNVAWAPLAADFKVSADKVDFVPLQGLLVERQGLLITKGAASFAGTIKAAGAPLNVNVVGDASLDDFNMLDTGTSEDLLRWKRLELKDVTVNTLPLDVSIKTLTQSDLFARVTIMPDGTLRLREVMVGDQLASVAAIEKVVEKQAEERSEKKVSKTATGTVTTAEVVEDKPALPIRIDELVFRNGNVIFHDRFIKPNYRANLTQLSGTAGPLQPGKPGLVAIKGSVNRAAPLEVKGKVDPFGKELYLDITAKAKGIDLPGFSPYSGRYVGYAIEKGKLSVDLHYFIEKSQLRAENHIFLDQLTFGEEVESAEAMSLPVKLAVSLLKNSRGEIDLDVPVSGSLNDPEFSIGGVIFKVIINLITKAVTAPFALLGSMFGGGADLSQIDFVPGYAQLTPEAEKSLDAISKAMLAKPVLKLEITGVANSVSDLDGLKRALLERRIKSQKLAAMAKKGESGGSLGAVELSSAEYPKYLELAYKAEKFDKPTNFIGMNKSLPVPEMEKLMLANMPADKDAMRALADRRARKAAEVLLEKNVPTERVFILQPKVETAVDDKKMLGRVEFSLR